MSDKDQQYPAPREAGRTRTLAVNALISSLAAVRGVHLDARNRARDIAHVVCPSIPAPALDAALADIRQGDGGELRMPQAPPPEYPRFHSYRSSCALAVNAFGPWRTDPSGLRVAGLGGFTGLRFERKLPIRGVDRNPPNLDVVAEGPTTLAIESKLIEHLERTKPAHFAPAYGEAVSALAHPSWAAAYARLEQDPARYRHFGAAQVVKHYLGVKSAGMAPTRLLYLYWEPLDRSAHRLFSAHRWEVEDFSSSVNDPAVEFLSMSYPELFAEWGERSEPAWLAEHVGCLRQRYGLRLGDSNAVDARRA